MSELYDSFISGNITHTAEQFWKLTADKQVEIVNEINKEELLRFIRIMLLLK